MTPLIAIPAAGASRRMRGRDKLLEIVDGEPLLRRQARAALATGCPTLVLLRPTDRARRNALDGLEVTIEEVADHATGLSATLRQAAEATEQGQPLCLMMPDIPGIDTGVIRDLIETFRNAGGVHITRAVDQDNQPGFPVILPHAELKRLTQIDGDRGLRLTGWLAMKMPDNRATRDLDTPEDWAAWRAEHPMR